MHGQGFLTGRGGSGTRGADRRGRLRGRADRAGRRPQSKPLGRLAGANSRSRRTGGRSSSIDAPPWLHRDLPFTVDLATGAYLHPESGRGLIGGSDRDTEEGADTTLDWELLPPLLTALTVRWPSLASAQVASGWAGLREMTPDDHALVGPADRCRGCGRRRASPGTASCRRPPSARQWRSGC